ncbi:MAG: hypothetical protein WAM53_17905 [Terrimicrobiaceae bacterium]
MNRELLIDPQRLFANFRRVSGVAAARNRSCSIRRYSRSSNLSK